MAANIFIGKIETMKNGKISPVYLAAFLGLLFAGIQLQSSAQSNKDQNMLSTKNDEEAIRALEDAFAEAVSAGDIDAIMSKYVPGKSLVVFDVVPRSAYRGADVYRKDWEDFYTHYQGNPKMTIIDLEITAEGNIAFSHCFMRLEGKDAGGGAVDRKVRVSVGYQKIGGKWLKAHEHISVPVDFKTGKAVKL
jgi:ketosteroid isomerase-like protein